MVSGGVTAMSAREAEVLSAVGEHLTNAEIAHRLHISIRTVESHVSSLLRKYDAADRRALAVIAARYVVSPPRQVRPFRRLPTAWTSFVGRTGEVDEVTAAVGAHRLVTLLGPGGIGKTRLAVVAAGRIAPAFGGGGAFVDLVPVGGGGVVSAVAAAIDAVDRPESSLEAVIHEQLRGGPALIVLDNCEHVLEAAAAWVQAALAACPDLVVLATSRERLGVAGERVFAVPSLGDDASVLFLDRASADGVEFDVDPAVVAAICRRLDGIPLAIELAAARFSSLDIDGLVAGLDDHLRLLGRSASPSGFAGRHRSLRAVIGWSHDLLDDEERALFRRVAVFAGRFDLAAAAAVAAGGDASIASDVIGRLVDKTLLVRGGDRPGSRWRMLDTVRAYAREQLVASQELTAIEGAHLRWAASAATALEAELGEDDAWAGRFDAIADDLRSAAMRNAPGELTSESFGLGLSLGHLTYARGLLAEARGHYIAAADRAPAPAAAIVAWRGAAAVARADQRLSLSMELLYRAAAAAEEGGDRAAAALALADIAREVGRFPSGFDEAPDRDATLALIERARSLDPGDDLAVRTAIVLAAAWNGRPEPTEPDPALAAEALVLARELGDPMFVSDALDAVAASASSAGRRKEAARITVERLGLIDQMPRHSPGVGLEVFDAFHMATETAVAAGDLDAALATGRRAQSDSLDSAVPYMAASRIALPLVLLGDFDEALVQAQLMRDSWIRAGKPTAGWMVNAFFAAAMVHGLRGDAAAFDEWWQIAAEESTRSSTNETRAFVEQRVALHQGRFDDATLELSGPVSDGSLADYARSIRVEVAIVTGVADADVQLRAAHPLAAENEYAAAILQRASGRLHHNLDELEAAVSSWETIGARFELACTLTLIPARRAQGERELSELGCPMPAPVDGASRWTPR
jgi:predicted ATPase/DNA-binding CsgD family transcriptional regulator